MNLKADPQSQVDQLLMQAVKQHIYQDTLILFPKVSYLMDYKAVSNSQSVQNVCKNTFHPILNCSYFLGSL